MLSELNEKSPVFSTIFWNLTAFLELSTVNNANQAMTIALSMPP
jgi:uncharacterized membrane protein YjfL (UPF0719 family)